MPLVQDDRGSPRFSILDPRFSVFFLLLLIACGSAPPKGPRESPTPAAKPAAPPGEVTGREAFQQMWVTARSWAPDAQPFRLANLPMDNSPGIGGKAAAWAAAFSSESLHKWRSFSFSTVKTENVHLGVFGWRAESFRTVSELSGQPFPVQSLKTDSDEAFRLAEQKGGREFRRKNQVPVNMVVEFSPRDREVVWSVYYSASPNDSRFTVRISAATGTVLKVEK